VRELLLDTCAFLWLALDPDRIPDKAAAVLNDTRNPRLLSQVSVLEIVLKYRVGKLPLPLPPEMWIPSRREFFSILDIPLSDSVIYQSGHLTSAHPDPFDRLIAAQAMERDCAVLTSDPRIRELGARVIWRNQG
jgi:PIN domain nuclease of toxin-antitoxin system